MLLTIAARVGGRSCAPALAALGLLSGRPLLRSCARGTWTPVRAAALALLRSRHLVSCPACNACKGAHSHHEATMAQGQVQSDLKALYQNLHGVILGKQDALFVLLVAVL